MPNFISGNKDWLDEELAGCKFKDERLGKRFTKLLAQMWDGVGESIPFACQDWNCQQRKYIVLVSCCSLTKKIMKMQKFFI